MRVGPYKAFRELFEAALFLFTFSLSPNQSSLFSLNRFPRARSYTSVPRYSARLLVVFPPPPSKTTIFFLGCPCIAPNSHQASTQTTQRSRRIFPSVRCFGRAGFPRRFAWLHLDHSLILNLVAEPPSLLSSIR